MVILVLAVGCGEGGSAPLDAPPAGDPAPQFPSAPRGSVRVVGGGGIAVTLHAAAPAPLAREVGRAGSCRLLEVEPGGCAGPCAGACVGGECLPFPTAISAGPVTLAGLEGGPVVLPFDPSAGYLPPLLPGGALFTAGAEVTVSAPGDAFPAFSLSAAAVAPIAPVGLPSPLTLAPGADAVFRWTPADAQSRVRLTLVADELHGLPPLATIECDAPDAGEVTVPAALVDMFLEPEHWGTCGRCPVSSIMRYRRAATADVELWLGAAVRFQVSRY